MGAENGNYGTHARYEVALAPAAIRAVLGLRGPHDREELATTLRTELMTGPNATVGLELRLDSDGNAGQNGCGNAVYTVVPLSFNGYTVLYRPMTAEELARLRRERNRPVDDCGFYVIDILPAESAFGRPRLV
jgi:hypothetical protein